LGEDVGATLERLKAAGHSLPDPPASGGNYLPYRIVGNLVFLPGVISSWNGVLKFSGTVGEALSVEEGYEAAQLCALNLLANLQAAVGDLDRVRQIVSVNGYVNCVPGFSATPKVINGASDLLVAVFGDAGRHVRAAVGVAGLPLDAAVEIQMTVELHPE
jgi:enamine deaminase RidA (YjgF/YER057c/UK114 family)